MGNKGLFNKLGIIIAGLFLIGILGFFWSIKNKEMNAVPVAKNYTEVETLKAQNSSENLDTSKNPTAAAPKDYVLPEDANLLIPFTSQAPHQNWSSPYNDFCEEASILMVASYIKNNQILNSNDADAKMLSIMDFEMKRFGYNKDTTAEETAIILREFYNLQKVKVVYNPTIQDIKFALAQGQAIIAPLAGREINNPNFRTPGPLYHMLVIKGYDKKNNFITNDPGTRKGADYKYKAETIMKALHDWNNGDVYNGREVVIIIG